MRRLDARFAGRQIAFAGAVAAAMLGAVGAQAAQAASITEGGVADTYSRSDRPGTNYGTSDRVVVSGGSATAQGFLRFDVQLAAGTTLSKATLRLHAQSQGGSAGVSLQGLADTTWAERTLTWNNEPAASSSVVDRATGYAKGSWVALDASSLVKGAGLVSMVLTTTGSGSRSFDSRDASGNKPQLVLETTATPTPTPTPTSTPTSTPTPTPTPTPTATPTPTPTAGDPVVTIAGDIADDGSGDSATADLILKLNPTTVLTAGDNAYPDGALADFRTWFDPTWGRFKSKIRPAVGNHEYHQVGASGYFDYFDGVGASTGPAGDRDKGYYSFDLGGWHLIALNNYVSMSAGSAQEQWLKADLAAHPTCTLAYWHEPRFTSGLEHGDNTDTAPLWNDLYGAGADVVVNGHNHQYERFAPQNPQGQLDSIKGIREFVAGTGGAGLYPFGTIQPNSEVRNDTANGVLKFTLHPGTFDWTFEPAAGATFTDSGTGTCHRSTTASATPTPTPTPTPTATPIATATPTPSPTSAQYPMRGMFFRQSNDGFDTELADGFNLIDSVPSEVAALPSGVRGLTWVGDYDKTLCTWEVSDAQISSYVTAHKGDPKVGVWFIADEPWIGGTPQCPNAPQQVKARSALIHSIDPAAKTLMVVDSNSDQATLDQMPAWKGATDIVALNPYMCWQNSACHFEWIDKVAQAGNAAGLPIWGVIQAYGDPVGGGQEMCTTTSGCGFARLPTAAEIHEEFVHWRATAMTGYLVFSWRWPADTPSLWLENHPELQTQLKTENG